MRAGRKATHARGLVLQAALYGIEVMGMSKNAQQDLRRSMTASLHTKRAGRQCATATLAMTGGPEVDPVVLAPATVIGHWARKAWNGGLQGITDQGWQEQLMRGATLIGGVGPVRAYVCHCRHIGRDPMGAGQVRDKRGTLMDLREVSPAWVMQKAKADAGQAAFELTRATRRDAEGVQYGVDSKSTKGALGTWRKTRP